MPDDLEICKKKKKKERKKANNHPYNAMNNWGFLLRLRDWWDASSLIKDQNQVPIVKVLSPNNWAVWEFPE